jgi:hypothetical protein
MKTRLLTFLLLLILATPAARTQQGIGRGISGVIVPEMRPAPIGLSSMGASNAHISTRGGPLGHFFLSVQNRINVGPVGLLYERYINTSYCDVVASPDEIIFPDFQISTKAVEEPFVINSPMTLRELVAMVNDSSEVRAEAVPQKLGTRVYIRTVKDEIGVTLDVTGTIAKKTDSRGVTESYPFVMATPDYVISLNATSKQDLIRINDERKQTGERNQEHLSVYVEVGGGSVVDLESNNWWLDGQSKPLGLLVVGDPHGSGCEKSDFTLNEISTHNCRQEFVLVRRILNGDGDIIVGAAMETGPASSYPARGSLVIKKELLEDSDQSVFVNGRLLRQEFGPYKFENAFVNTLSIYRNKDGCRQYPKASSDWATIKIYSPLPRAPKSEVANGITVGPGKIFDTTALKKMLNDTATQLASLSGFNTSSIIGAFGNLQGLTRDTSYLGVQVTTAPLPGVTSTSAGGLTTNGTGTTTVPVPGNPGTVTVQCPDGSLPTIGTGGVQGCIAAPSGTNVLGSSSAITTVPAGTSQQTNGTTVNQQNSQTTTANSFAPTIPVVPASTAFVAPTNIGIASADVLAEQVQLNSQITTLRLLLQGASSDQYLTAGTRPTATRAQTTLGFSVSIDPPRQFKHAVAEVRIIVVPPPERADISIMNLLPSEKTYNVAKVTSNQYSFGAGVTIEAIGVGVNTGRSRDRLYLAKDTDTVALQFKGPGVALLDELSSCGLKGVGNGATVFGWQFKPVLGEEYVKSGQRQVFAQLALPAGLNEEYDPIVFVQTVWRAYDLKKQVVGAVYEESCSMETDRNGIMLLNPVLVRDMNITDIGSGQIRLTANGDFFAPGLAIRSGAVSVSPTSFDGTNLEVFASVHDILQSGDIRIVTQNGIKQPFATTTDPAKRSTCGIAEADMTAVPRSDGNSKVHLRVKLGASNIIRDDEDGLPQPFVLIGSQVYGVQENPFLSSSNCRQAAIRSGVLPSAECNYDFLAPTSVLRNAQNFVVQDPSWDSFRKTGTITFAPSFDKLAIASTTTSDDKSAGTNVTVLTISGFEFDRFDLPCDRPYCLKVCVGDTCSLASAFKIFSPNEAAISLTNDKTVKPKNIRFIVSESKDSLGTEWDLALPKSEDSTKPSVSPAYLYKGDSQTVTVSSGDVDFSTVKHVLFDGKPYPTPPLDVPRLPTDKLTLPITTDVTKTVGRKEFTIELLGSDSKLKKLTFTIDVVLR